MNNNYTADSIKVLKGLDAVRKRPGMYIGNTDDISGLHHMLTEVVDNAIDEALAGFCKNIDVCLHTDNSASVADDGRGIPTGLHKSEGISAAEVIMTQLHAGGKFSQEVYEVSGGLHGVGVSVVNALSSKLELKIYQNKHIYEAEFARGATVKPLAQIGNSTKHGTYIRFWPDEEIFSVTQFEYKLLSQRFRELAFLNPGVRIKLHDERSGESVEFYDVGGIAAFTRHICGSKVLINKTPLVIKEKYNDVDVECVIYWTQSYTEVAQYFTNTIPQLDGGTHVAGLRSGLTKSFQNYVKEKGTKTQQKTEFTGEDLREGMCCVLSVKVADPKFASQTKEKLVSSNVRQAVEHVTTKYTSAWLEENPHDTAAVINKIIDSANARDAARRARDLSRKGKGGDVTFQVAKKLAACSEKDPAKCQLFIVEGDSAGGSVKQARDRFTQAVLPLRGKILNIERVTKAKALGSEMIATLISAIGTGIMDEFSLSKLRYHRIVIMTDADVDGGHIEALLLTFFFRYMPQLIENGHIYIASPPLYGIVSRKGVEYLRDDKAFYRYIFTRGINSSGAKQSPEELEAFLNAVREVRRHLLHPVFEVIVTEKAINSSEIDVDAVHRKLGVGWSVQGKILTRIHNGVTYHYDLNAQKVAPLESFIEKWGHMWPSEEIGNPFEFFDKVYESGSRGLQVQRYKGLGEMPLPPLMDAMNEQSIVRLEDVELAAKLCTDLMGQDTEARKEFIETYATEADVDL